MTSHNSEKLAAWNSGNLIPGLQGFRTKTLGNPQIRVAVLDSEINANHPLLKHQNLPTTSAAAEHGTHIASVIAGQGYAGGNSYYGISPQTTLISIPIYKTDNNSNPIPCTQQSLAEAIHQACDSKAHIINISGGELNLRTPNKGGVLGKAVIRAYKENRLIVSATGNDGRSVIHAPACFPEVLAVGAADWDGRPLSFSNFGTLYKHNAVLAPGLEIPGADAGQGLSWRTGTSFATPVVSAISALLLSRMLQLGLAPDPHYLRELFLRTAAPAIPQEKLPTERILVGRIHFERLFKTFEQEQAKRINKEKTMTDITHSSQSTGTAVIPSIAEQSISVVPTQPQAAMVNAAAHTAIPAGMVPVMMTPQATMMPAGYMPAPLATPAPAPVSPVAAPVQPAEPAPSAEVKASEDTGAVGSPRNPGQLINFLGSLGFDFGIEARQDFFIQRLQQYTDDANLDLTLVRYLVENDAWQDAELLTWTVKLDNTPIYAIRPIGSDKKSLLQLLAACLYYQQSTNIRPGQPGTKAKNRFKTNAQREIEYEYDGKHEGKFCLDRLRSEDPVKYGTYMEDEIQLVRAFAHDMTVDRIAFCGEIVGETVLYNGTRVPVIAVTSSNVHPWDTSVIIHRHTDGKESSVQRDCETAIRRALEKIYTECKNDGLSEEDRAINYAGTNILTMQDIFDNVYKVDMPGANGEPTTKYELDKFYVEDSKVQRPTSILKDVVVRFFEPGNLDRAHLCYRFTVDVSDINPVLVEGKPQKYFDSSTRNRR